MRTTDLSDGAWFALTLGHLVALVVMCVGIAVGLPFLVGAAVGAELVIGAVLISDLRKQ